MNLTISHNNKNKTFENFDNYSIHARVALKKWIGDDGWTYCEPLPVETIFIVDGEEYVYHNVGMNNPVKFKFHPNGLHTS